MKVDTRALRRPDGSPSLSQLDKRHKMLINERLPWFKQWQTLSDWLQIRRGRYLTSERSKPKWSKNIANDTGQWAVSVMQAGLQSGVTSPSRPWFRLKAADEDLNKRRSVKVWLAETTRRMLAVLAQSNFYDNVQMLYGEQGVFGTGCMMCVPDADRVVHFYTLTAGQYCLATDHRQRVNTLYREESITVGQMAQWFGLENLSANAQSAYRMGNVDQYRPIVHAVEPREARDLSSPLSIHMPYRSIYYEQGREGPEDILGEGGFAYAPFVGPRWETLAGDPYGYGPGFNALGQVRLLQNEERRKGQAIDKMANPPMRAPTSMQLLPATTLPGGMTYVPSGTANDTFGPVYQVDPRINELKDDILEVENRIKRAFYADLFLAMLGDHRLQRATATEVAERHAEKLLMLGPALQRQGHELLDRVIDIVFDIMWEEELLPEPPEELELAELEVEYVSILHTAQKASETVAIERGVQFVQALAQTHPNAVLKLDEYQATDDYAEALGVDPKMIVPTEDAKKLAAENRKAEARAMMAEQAGQAAQTAQTMAATPTPDGGNALEATLQAVA